MPRKRSEESNDDREMRSAVARRIAAARKARDMTQRALADEVGVDQNHLSRLERGESWPAVNTVIAICKALDVSADWVLFNIGAGPAGTLGSPPPSLEDYLREHHLSKDEEQWLMGQFSEPGQPLLDMLLSAYRVTRSE